MTSPDEARPDWPERADCARCGHSSDVHVHPGTGPLSATASAGQFPCEECDCPTMIRTEINYQTLVSRYWP